MFQAMGGLEPGEIWLSIVLGHLTRAALGVLRFKQGKWRRIAVDNSTLKDTLAMARVRFAR